MNETKLVIIGLIALVIAAMLLWILEKQQILVDKEVEVATVLGVGLLILILDRRADRRLRKFIHEQHQLINKIHNQVNEPDEPIKFMQKRSEPQECHTGNTDSQKTSPDYGEKYSNRTLDYYGSQI